MDVIEFSNPKILFIKGVFLKDCTPIDDLFDQQLMNRAHDEETVNVSLYIPLPSMFYDLKQWPKKTSLKCYYCDRNFDEVPKFIPRSIDPAKDGYIMSTEGCFCTFNCASAYIDLMYQKINDNINKKNMLKLLYKVFNGNSTVEIESAPSKYLMLHYGGTLNVNDYGKLLVR